MEPLTAKDLDLLAKELPLIKAWVEAVERELLALLESGVVLENVSLVPTRPSRQWDRMEPEELIQLLTRFSPLDKVAPRVPLSPAQAEKTLGRSVYSKELAQFVVRKSSGTTLRYT